MSEEAVEVIREAWKAFGEAGMEAVLEYCADDCVSEDFPELPDGATYHGPDGYLERYRHFAEAWGEFVIAPVEFIGAGDGAVVVVVEMTGSGPASGTPLDARAGFLYEVRNAKIAYDRAFTSRSQALEAARLAEGSEMELAGLEPATS